MGALLLMSLLIAQTTGTGTVDVDGGRIHYEVAGSGPVVVLVHGGFGDRRMWEAQFRELAKRYRVVRYDHRGFGKSSAPTAAYSPVDDLVALLDRVGARKAHLVGNSLGGSLVLDAALKRPDRVASATMIASSPSGFPVPKEDYESVAAVFEAVKTKGSAAAADLWFAHPMVAVTSKQANTRDLLRTMISDNASVFEMEHWPDEPMTPLANERLKEVKVPMLVVYGDRDVATVQNGSKAAAAGIPGAKLAVIRGGDHLPQMTHPVELNRVLLEFLDTAR